MKHRTQHNMKIVFATNNSHKLDEARKILGNDFEVVSLADINCHDELPETSNTLEGNALQKANYVWEHFLKGTNTPVVADDTGLEVDALGGEPGVRSARYDDNSDHDSEANMRKLLAKLAGKDNRKARFRTSIALLVDNGDTGKEGEKYNKYAFEGIVDGNITNEKHGTEGFGYDPIFQPDGYDKTFAELGAGIKNTISHRARAMQKLADFIKSNLLALCILIAMLAGGSQIAGNGAAAQGVGTWQCYWAYNDITEIQPAGKKVFVLSSKGLFSYNVADQSVETYDKMNVLNDCNIAHIRFSPQTKRLLIAYENQNIDLIDLDGNVINISNLYKKSMTEDKTINHIYINGTDAYCATGFGIMKINMRDAEVANTYMLGFSVDHSYIDRNNIYAASKEKGLYCARLSDNLLDKSVWKRVGEYKANDENMRLVADDTNKCFWTADENNSLTAYKLVDGNKVTTVTAVKPDGPAYNYYGYMVYNEGRLYTCGGGYGALSELNRKPAAQIYENGEWRLLEEDLQATTGHRYVDALVIANEPGNPNHIFVGGQTGLYEFNDTKFVKHYNIDNSPLQSATSNNSKNYVLVEGMAFDDSGNLWVANSQAKSTSLACLGKDGQWSTVSKAEFMNGERSLSAMKSLMFDSRGLLWFTNAHWEKTSFYAYDTKTGGVNSYTSFINEDGIQVNANSVNHITEDYEGNMWISTNVAPLLLLKENIGDGSNAVLQQVKVPRNDGTNLADYLLDGVSTSCIVVDGGGRKWVGTTENGVYLISADNMSQIYHFMPENSKLLSNNIESIAINDETGEVFFGTDRGLCSFMSNATSPSDEMTTDNVYAYPNPVSPDYTGLITVTGLTYDADVKIVTSNGVLVAQGRSNGGSFTWDGCDTKGRKVASGVYMVQTATSTGEKGTVCKIAIVR